MLFIVSRWYTVNLLFIVSRWYTVNLLLIVSRWYTVNLLFNQIILGSEGYTVSYAV